MKVGQYCYHDSHLQNTICRMGTLASNTNSTEFNCTLLYACCSTVYTNCSSTEFKCTYAHHCIPLSDKCDGFYDCLDRSDELPINCPGEKHCPKGHFHCSNARCINETLICNNNNDCGDLSDELACSKYIHSLSDKCQEKINIMWLFGQQITNEQISKQCQQIRNP